MSPVSQAMQLSRVCSVEAFPLELVRRPVPEPKVGQVRVKVEACGVCHTDLHTVEGTLALPRLPLVPGQRQELRPKHLCSMIA